jgi:hypothetical protein
MPRLGGMRQRLLVAVGILLVSPVGAASQAEARTRVAENFRRDPNGVVLARLSPGTPVRVLARQERWTQVEVRGYVWLRSLQRSDQEGFDLVVSADGGENLRAGPSGDILARLEEGALLDEVGRDPAWAEVSRSGWVWSASLDDAAGATAGGPMIQPEAPPAVRSGATPAESASRRPGGFVSVGAAGGPVLASPGGDTLAVAAGGSDIEVVGREGNWVRVRVDGWMWMPEAGDAELLEAEPSGALEPDDLVNQPGAYVGRAVSWDLQFISVERAEAVRTDFFEGEPFLLTRFGGADGPFVYVAFPAERLTEVEGLVPLERITVTARVRTGASALTATPIVDLLTIEPSREDG